MNTNYLLDDEGPARLRLATIGLRLSQIIYFLLLLCSPIVLLILPNLDEEKWVVFLSLFCAGGTALGCVIGLEVVLRGLAQKKYWAWVAALCVAGLYIPSIFLPFGVMVLVGLLDRQVQAEFLRERRSA